MSESEISDEHVREALRQIFDPEIGINIIDLGLVYDIAVEGDVVRVEMTFTTEGCPVAGKILVEVEEAIANLSKRLEPDVRVTFDPPWSPEMISPEGKAMLGS